jgi:3-oxoacyl-[acyl-carrier-protein] synthase-3
MKQHFAFIGSARVLPARTISATELDERLGLKPGWTEQHTGVLVRHQCSGTDEALALLRTVCLNALADAGLQPGDMDLIVDGSLCLQQPIPNNAALVQAALGPAARGVACLDVHASCLGFLAALNAVNGFFAAGTAKHALIVCAETPLQGVNWAEPESACLMGDGAAAVVVEKMEPARPGCFLFETYAEGVRLCEVRGGGHRLPPFAYAEENRADYQFHMDGKAVHRLASQLLPPMLARALNATGRSLDELEVVPHQASGPALEFMRRRLGITPDRFHVSIAEHGNMVAAGMPYVLDGVRRQRPRGTPLLLIGTAAGYTQAAAIVTL